MLPFLIKMLWAESSHFNACISCKGERFLNTEFEKGSSCCIVTLLTIHNVYFCQLCSLKFPSVKLP